MPFFIFFLLVGIFVDTAGCSLSFERLRNYRKILRLRFIIRNNQGLRATKKDANNLVALSLESKKYALAYLNLVKCRKEAKKSEKYWQKYCRKA